MPAENHERWAQVGIVVQFLALIRTLGEIFRLQYYEDTALRMTDIQPFIVAATITAVLALIAVILYFAKRHDSAVGVAGLTVVILLVYKFGFMR